MKFLFILSAVFITTAQANVFTDLGQGFTNLFETLGQSVLHQLDTTGVQLLNASVAAGKTLISQGIQALALNTANALGSRSLQLPPMLQNVESSLHNVVDTLTGEMKNVFGFLVKGLQGVVDKLAQLDVTPQEVISEVDKLVNAHNLVADSFLKTIKDKAEEVISSLIKNKRNAFTDFFSGIGSSLPSTFQPMVDGVKTVGIGESLTKTFKPVVDGVKLLATSAGGAIKSGATNLLQNAKDSVAQLGQKLQPHITNIGEQLGNIVAHGANAVNALKQAGGDILQQTLTNLKEPVNKIGQTVVNAGETVVGHVAAALLGTNTDPATTTMATSAGGAIKSGATNLLQNAKDSVAQLGQKLQPHITNIGEQLGNIVAHGANAVNALKQLQAGGDILQQTLTNIKEPVNKIGQTVVNAGETVGHVGHVAGALLGTSTDPATTTMATSAGGAIKSGATNLLQNAKDSVAQLGQKLQPHITNIGEQLGNIVAHGANAVNALKQLQAGGDILQQTLTNIKEPVNKIGQTVVNAGETVGHVGHVAGALLGTSTDPATTTMATSAGGAIKSGATNLLQNAKDSVAQLGQKLQPHITNIGEQLGNIVAHGANAVNALKQLQAGGDILQQTLTNIKEPVNKIGQTVVNAGETVVGHVAGALLGTSTDPATTTMATSAGGAIKSGATNLLQNAKDSVAQLGQKLQPHITNIGEQLGNIVAHGANAVNALKQLQAGGDILQQTLTNIKEPVNKIGQTVVNAGETVVGHLAGALLGTSTDPATTTMATSAGGAIKSGATNLLQNAKDSVAQLGQKLQPHITNIGDIVAHGANAVNALKQLQAGGDILQQTLTNIKEPVNKIGQTVVNAGETVVGHVAGALLGTSTDPATTTMATSAGGAIKSGATNLLQNAKDSVAQLGQKLQPHITNIGEQLGNIVAHGANAVNALKQLQAGGDILQQTLTNIKEPVNKIGQTVVNAGETVVGHLAGALLGTSTDPATTTMATSAGGAIKSGATNLLQNAKDSVAQLGQKLQPHITNIGEQLGNIVAHGANAVNALKQLQAGGDILQQTLTNIKEPVNKIGQTVVNAGETVVGHLAGALLGTSTDPATTTMATSAGGAIKSGATNLLQNAKDSVAQLGQKLQPHITNIGEQLGNIVAHGANAVNALKQLQAGGDILQQTLTNIKEPVNKIGQTVVNAGETVVGHVAGALMGTNNDPVTTTVTP